MSEIKAIDTMNRLYYCKPELFKEAYKFYELKLLTQTTLAGLVRKMNLKP